MMRKICFLTVIFLTGMACENPKNADIKTITIRKEVVKEPDASGTQYTKAEFTIEGMTCAIGCASAIENHLATMKGVKTAIVNFENNSAVVVYNHAKITPEDLTETVNTTGNGEQYRVTHMVVNTDEKISTPMH